MDDVAIVELDVDVVGVGTDAVGVATAIDVVVVRIGAEACL